ncbi:MAG: hypothetical protein WCH39_01650 [Schlesneria sp.]
MRGVYDINFQISSKNDNKSLLALTPPSGKVLQVISATVSTTSNTTMGFAECCFSRITTLGSLAGTTLADGTAITPEEQADQASGITALGTITTEATTYGPDLAREGWNTLSSYRYNPSPEERLTISGTTPTVLRMPTAPSAGAVNLDVSVKVQIIG